MVENLIICVNAVLPSAIYLIIGVCLKSFKVVTDDEIKRFTQVTFLALYPFLMFDNLYGKNLEEHLNWLLIVYVLGFLAFQIGSSWLYVTKTEPDNYNRGAMIQALFRSNIVLMGLPIATNLFGKANTASVAVVIMFVVPLYNIMSVIVLEKFRGGHADFKNVLKGIITNPLIVGGIVALIVMGLRLTLPETIHHTIETLSEATTPICMILLGASLNIRSFNSDRIKVATCVIAKIIVFPALGILGAVLLGISGVDLVAVVLVTATPTALASFAMASSMGGNGELAGEAVVVSTFAACITMSLWLFILKTNGLF